MLRAPQRRARWTHTRGGGRTAAEPADRPNLVRLSLERQLQDPEVTFTTESEDAIEVDREREQVPATEELAEILGITPGDKVDYVITRVAEGGRPVSISDTYQPLDAPEFSAATDLEETLSDQLPSASHAEWLHTPPGDLVKSVQQHYFTSDGRVIMVSNISYPMDRYDAFVFRMKLTPES